MNRIDVSELCVPIGSTVQHALEAIDRTAQGVCFVVDADGVLAGIASDGDLRRAILGGAGIATSIEQAMRRECVTLSHLCSLEEIQASLSDSIRVIPILDGTRRVVDFVTSTRPKRIPIMEPSLGGNEAAYVMDCLRTNWISSQGKYVHQFEESFCLATGAAHAVAVMNGTVAIQLALSALKIGPGDEVIVPALTFAATANAVLSVGATPVIVDVDPMTWNLSCDQAEQAVTPRTRAVIPVHLYGVPCEMGDLQHLASSRGLYLVEDCAESLGTTVEGRHTGTFGVVGCFSFFGNKTITTGEGGMVITPSSEVAERMRMLRDHGMNKARRYWHEAVGYNFRLTNLQAAIGVAQLERLPGIVGRKAEIARRYRTRLGGCKHLELPPVPDPGTLPWLFTILLSPSIRDEVASRLSSAGIETRRVFYSLDEMPLYQRYSPHPCSNARSLSSRGLSLPSAPTLNQDEVDAVSAAVLSALERVS